MSVILPRMEFTGHHVEMDDDFRLEGRTKLLAYNRFLGEVFQAKKYDVPESVVYTPFNPAHAERASEIAEKLLPLKHLVVIGIGGSSVGIEALYHALKSDTTPALHILDMLDEERVDRTLTLLKQVALEDIALAVISKSGTTTETLANADVCLTALHDHFGDALFSRVVCVGNAETKLAHYAEEKNMLFAVMPSCIGGRFSIFTEVGLVPLTLLGLDVTAFLAGARATLSQALSGDESGGIFYGTLLASHMKNGLRTYVLFSEQPRLDGYMRWLQQLMAESLGKLAKDGTKVGMIPVIMTPRELHSTAQLYLSGFEGVFTEFLSVKNISSAYTLSTTGLGEMIRMPSPRMYDTISKAIMEGVHSAYNTAGLPHGIFSIEAINAEVLGGLMAEKMLEIMYTAHLLDINAFDQPHVELYKKETRMLLEKEIA